MVAGGPSAGASRPEQKFVPREDIGTGQHAKGSVAAMQEEQAQREEQARATSRRENRALAVGGTFGGDKGEFAEAEAAAAGELHPRALELRERCRVASRDGVELDEDLEALAEDVELSMSSPTRRSKTRRPRTKVSKRSRRGDELDYRYERRAASGGAKTRRQLDRELARRYEYVDSVIVDDVDEEAL